MRSNLFEHSWKFAGGDVFDHLAHEYGIEATLVELRYLLQMAGIAVVKCDGPPVLCANHSLVVGGVAVELIVFGPVEDVKLGRMMCISEFEQRTEFVCGAGTANVEDRVPSREFGTPCSPRGVKSMIEARSVEQIFGACTQDVLKVVGVKAAFGNEMSVVLGPDVVEMTFKDIHVGSINFGHEALDLGIIERPPDGRSESAGHGRRGYLPQLDPSLNVW